MIIYKGLPLILFMACLVITGCKEKESHRIARLADSPPADSSLDTKVDTSPSKNLSVENTTHNLGFTCQATSRDDGHVWKYEYEIDKNTSKGVRHGTTYGGSPSSDDIEVVFTPDRMLISYIGKGKYDTSIDRRDLSFNNQGEVGSCVQTTIDKQEPKF